MKSKILLLITIVWSIPSMLMAQHEFVQDHRPHYLFGVPLHYNGFGGPLVSFSNMEGKFSIAPGAMGGIIINNKFFISAYGQSVVTSHPRADLIETSNLTTYSAVDANMWQVGLWFGYIHKADEVIHWGVSSMIARGQLFLMAKDPVTFQTRQIFNDRVYFITPKIFVEMNMATWMKVNVSAGFRFTGKVNGQYLNRFNKLSPTFYKSDYDQPEFSLSLLFGGFRSKSD
ncbi:MAG: hypothetical protein ACOYMF_04150 [Bacteroidales bacterium]